MAALAVKRSDVDVVKEPRAHALFGLPAITQGRVTSDGQLFDVVRALPADTEILLVGHGWTEQEMFTVRLTPLEFIQHWKGD